MANDRHLLTEQQFAALKAFLATLENDQQLLSVAWVVEDQLQSWSVGKLSVAQAIEAGVPAHHAAYVARVYAAYVSGVTDFYGPDCYERYKAGEFLPNE